MLRSLECGAGGDCFWLVLQTALGVPMQQLKERVLDAFQEDNWRMLHGLVSMDYGRGPRAEMAHWTGVMRASEGSYERFKQLGRSFLLAQGTEVDPVTVSVAFEVLGVDAVVSTQEPNGAVRDYDAARGTGRHPGRPIVWLVYLIGAGHYRLMEYGGKRIFNRVSELHPSLLAEMRSRNPGWLQEVEAGTSSSSSS